MGLSDNEKRRIAYHLGHPLNTAGAGKGMLYPTLVQNEFPVYAALSHIEDGAEEIIRDLLSRCEAVDAQMASAQGRLKVSAVGDVDLRDDEMKQLQATYRYWQGRLSSATGAPINEKSPAQGGGCMIRRVH